MTRQYAGRFIVSALNLFNDAEYEGAHTQKALVFPAKADAPAALA